MFLKNERKKAFMVKRIKIVITIVRRYLSIIQEHSKPNYKRPSFLKGVRGSEKTLYQRTEMKCKSALERSLVS
jgi:hypothetical protein